MYDGEFNHIGGGGSGGGPVAAAAAVAVVAAEAAVEDIYWWKRPATKALTIARWHAMTKLDGRQQCNNQLANTAAAAA